MMTKTTLWDSPRRTCRLMAWSAALLAGSVLGTARGDVLAHWSFDEADGNGVYVDAINNAHPATPADRGSISVTDGKFGKGVRLNGSSGAYFTIPALTGIQKNSFTFAAWVNFATPGPSFVLTDWPSFTTQSFVFGINPLDKSKANEAQLIADLASSEKMGGNNRGNQNNRKSIVRQAVNNEPVPQNEWHHLAWIWDREGQTLTVYMDGDSVNEAKKQSGGQWSRTLDLAENNHTMRIGSQEAAQGNVVPTFNGALDELWLFDKAISRAQLRNLIKFNDIQGEVAVATVTPAAPVTPTPAPTVGTSGAAGSGGSAPVMPRSVAVETPPIPMQPNREEAMGSNGNSRLTAGRMVGIVGCLVVIVSMSCYLIWAVMERGKMRVAGR